MNPSDACLGSGGLEGGRRLPLIDGSQDSYSPTYLLATGLAGSTPQWLPTCRTAPLRAGRAGDLMTGPH